MDQTVILVGVNPYTILGAKKLFEFVTEVILALFLFLFLSCKSDFSELNEDLQGENRGEKSRKERD
ncbi:MAG: hypothetical protein RSB23_07055 [Alistipes sp.]